MKRKFNYLWLSFLVIFLIMQSSSGQSIKNEEVFYRFPEDKFLAQRVFQNRSPVQFESIDILFERSGKMPILNWKLKNNSSKAVREFVIAFNIQTNINKWLGMAGHIEYGSGKNRKVDLILPQKTYQEDDYEKVSLLAENELCDLFPYNKEWGDDMYIVVYGMVKKVVFDDDSIYEEDNKVFREFK